MLLQSTPREMSVRSHTSRAKKLLQPLTFLALGAEMWAKHLTLRQSKLLGKSYWVLCLGLKCLPCPHVKCLSPRKIIGRNVEEWSHVDSAQDTEGGVTSKGIVAFRSLPLSLNSRLVSWFALPHIPMATTVSLLTHLHSFLGSERMGSAFFLSGGNPAAIEGRDTESRDTHVKDTTAAPGDCH